MSITSSFFLIPPACGKLSVVIKKPNWNAAYANKSLSEFKALEQKIIDSVSSFIFIFRLAVKLSKAFYIHLSAYLHGFPSSLNGLAEKDALSIAMDLNLMFSTASERIRSDEGLTLETLFLKSQCGDQMTQY